MPPAIPPLPNLPAPLTRLIGRERELAQIQDRLAHTRLLTLTGAGGTGKTRLALEAARGLRSRFPDGVWLVELAPITDAALVLSAVATVLSVREAADAGMGRPEQSALIWRWRDAAGGEGADRARCVSLAIRTHRGRRAPHAR